MICVAVRGWAVPVRKMPSGPTRSSSRASGIVSYSWQARSHARRPRADTCGLQLQLQLRSNHTNLLWVVHTNGLKWGERKLETLRNKLQPRKKKLHLLFYTQVYKYSQFYSRWLYLFKVQMHPRYKYIIYILIHFREYQFLRFSRLKKVRKIGYRYFNTQLKLPYSQRSFVNTLLEQFS